MKTYQDLIKTAETERGDFCYSAIKTFMDSKEYKEAKDGEAYYNKHNVTIEKYKKLLTTLSGRHVEDIFSANYKLKTLFFRRLVTQQVQYVLGNGVTLENSNNKEKLGKDFDFKLQKAAKIAMAQGRAFGFWNVDHLEVFGFADTDTDAGFCPLYNEENAYLEAGIRFWFKKVDNKTIVRMTLYEADGFTEYIYKDDGKPAEVITDKTSYKHILSQTTIMGIVDAKEENYRTIPIIPLYANDNYTSELVGIRECIDCYDFIKSGLANEIDDTSGFYWILKNEGGMDDVDLAKFIQRMKTVKAATIDGEGGAEAHTIDVPVEARRTMLEILRKDIYEDFQALDVQTLSAAQKTTQEIQAAYQSQDNKCADFEYFIIDFVQQILELAGLEDNPTFNWNRIINQNEQTSMVLSAANYLPSELIIKHLPFLTPEEADSAIRDFNTEAHNLFNAEEDRWTQTSGQTASLND